jgi:hypothetical protein
MEALMHVGARIELTEPVESLGVRSKPGDRGTVTGLLSDGYLSVLMVNGRPQLPRRDEVRVLSDTE